jgi:hypothetical protein
MDRTRRGLLGVGGSAMAAVLAGCSSQGPSVPSLSEAAGSGGAGTRFGYRRDDLEIPNTPELVVARLDALDEHAAAFARPPRALTARDPSSDAVAAAVGVSDAATFAFVGGARVYAGVDASNARSVLAERGDPIPESPPGVFEGAEWTAAAFDDAVVTAAAPRVGSARARRQYVRSVRAAAVGDGERLLSASRPAKRVVGALPAGQYVDVSPSLPDVSFRSEAFGATVRADRTVLARARLAASHVDPSKRNARLNTVEGWRRRLAPDADVEAVTVAKDGRLVRVTGTVDTSDLEFA